MNRCLWFSKMSQNKLSIQYISMTAVNQTFLSKTSLQQFGEFLTPSPFLAPLCHKTYIHPASCDVTILFISLSVTKKTTKQWYMSQNYILMKKNLFDVTCWIVIEQRKFKCKGFFSKWQKKQWRKPKDKV